MQKNFSQSHLIVERLFNNVLKIRQNPSSKTLRTMAVKITIFSSYHGKPSFSEITTSDKRSRIYFIYIYNTGYPAMRLPSHSVSQAIPKLYFFFIARYLKGEIVQNLLTYLKKNNNNNSNSSKNVVGILAVLMACTVKTRN